MATINIENINIVVEHNQMAFVKVEYHAQGEVVRTARGTLQVSIEDFMADNSVDALKEKVRQAVIAEFNETEDDGDAE